MRWFKQDICPVCAKKRDDVRMFQINSYYVSICQSCLERMTGKRTGWGRDWADNIEQQLMPITDPGGIFYLI